jgi:hypothetical protein
MIERVPHTKGPYYIERREVILAIPCHLEWWGRRFSSNGSYYVRVWVRGAPNHSFDFFTENDDDSSKVCEWLGTFNNEG